MSALYFFVGVLGAAICARVASSKHRNVLGYAVFGFLLPLIGIIVVLCAKPKPAELAP